MERRSIGPADIPALRAPSPVEIAEFRAGVTINNPGVGILDTQTGQIYLNLASSLVEGDHFSMCAEVLGIVDFGRTGHLRGFVVCMGPRSWEILNNSGLNPPRNKMDKGLFNSLATVLQSCLGTVP